jgi:hypothetical protein
MFSDLARYLRMVVKPLHRIAVQPRLTTPSREVA